MTNIFILFDFILFVVSRKDAKRLRRHPHDPEMEMEEQGGALPTMSSKGMGVVPRAGPLQLVFKIIPHFVLSSSCFHLFICL